MNERKKTGIRPFWIFLGFFLGLPLILCGGIAVWWVGRNSVAQAELDQRKTEIQGRGFPINNATLSDFYAQNADNQYTGRWLSVIAAFDTQSFRDAVKDLPIVGLGEMPTPDQAWPEQPAIEKLLAEYQQTLDEVHEISKSDRPTLFPIEFDSFNTLLDSVQAMRNISRMLQLEHEVALRGNDSNREFQSINSMLGTSIALRGDPIMVSQLVSIALHGIAIEAIQSSVERGSMDDAQLAAIEERLKNFTEFHTPMRISIAGERAFILPMLEEPGSMEEIVPPGPVSLLGTLGPRPIDALFFLELSEEMEALSDLDLDSFVRENRAFERRQDEVLESRGWLKTFDTFMSTLVLPGYRSLGDAFIRQSLQNRIAESAIAIRRYRLQKGVYPDQLSLLAEIGYGPDLSKAINGDSFGYQIIDGVPTLWGYDFDRSTAFRFSEDTHVAAEPPQVSKENEINNTRLWIFE